MTKRDILFFVEGYDDLIFIKNLLIYLDLCEEQATNEETDKKNKEEKRLVLTSKNNDSTVKIYNLLGKDNFTTTKLKANLIIETANPIIKVAIIRDRDFDYNQEIEALISEMKNDETINAEYYHYLLPYENENGTLEDLVLELIKELPITKSNDCIDSFKNCLERNGYSANSKLILKHHLELIQSSNIQISKESTKGIREALQCKLFGENGQKIFDLKHEKLEKLKNFLKEIIT
jgi:hypothetical protein